MAEKKLLTVAEAAVLYEQHRRRLRMSHPDISPTSLKIYCWRGLIPAEKYGKMWLIRREDVLVFAEENLGPGPGGRPRKLVPREKPKGKPVKRKRRAASK